MKLLQGIALSFLLTIGVQVSAETTNPADLVIAGGESMYAGASDTTQLFLDNSAKGKLIDFWIKVVINPGTPIPNNAGELPPEKPIQTFIKYFPLSRYTEVSKQLRKIRTFGVVNPYLDGVVICDGPNSTIRVGDRTVIMAYNCGTDGPDADAATFKSEALMKALRTESIQDPDLHSEEPVQ